MSKATAAAARANEFLANMGLGADEEITEQKVPAAPKKVVLVAKKERAEKFEAVKISPSAASRQGLKHIGGYFEPEMVEIIALLRARLKLDNSQLIELAITELYNQQKAKKAFRDM